MHPGLEVSSGPRPAVAAVRRARLLLALLLIPLLGTLPVIADEPAAAEAYPPEAIEFFEKKIRPVLVERCYECHSDEGGDTQGGLSLDTREGTRQGGDSGAAVVPGDPEKSLLLEAIRYDGFEMPPDGRLAEQVIRDFETWIQLGAADPRQTAPRASSPQDAEPSQGTEVDWAKAKQFWAFQPPQRQTVPTVQRTEWPRTRIDHFLLSAMEAAELDPAEPAERRTLIRRVTFDLTGLPPTPEEVEAFAADEGADAYRLLVDRLLSSPRYGERMARMWLDVARYAEDQAHIVGNNRSLCYPNAYLYRDWVIEAFNSDLPYDQFIRQQLAADLIDAETPDAWVALGFLGLGPKYYRRGSLEVQADEWEDRVDVVTRGLLGLTVACARCHDHKYDPIPTEDYYALAGIFRSTEMFNRPLDDQREANDRGEAKEPDDAVHIVREGKPQNLPVFIRGNVENEGPEVPRRFLQILADEAAEEFTEGSGRRQLAEAIAEPTNPLTARVIVNRIWAMNFGRPLVATPSNFGTLGAAPSHPELLDDLAVRFVENGWSLKWLQRELVMSAAYRQSSHVDPEKLEADPENLLLARMSRRRLSIEALRDTVLAAAGQLDHAIGGPSIDPADPDQTRRTLYSEISRLELSPLLAMFDFPDPNLHSDGRVETTTPLQKLFVLNSPFMIRQAARLADRLLDEPAHHLVSTGPTSEDAQRDDAARIERAYRLLFGRGATEREVEVALEFFASPELQSLTPRERWQQYAQTLLAANELLFLD